MKDITYYFKQVKPNGLPSNVSQSTIEYVKRELKSISSHSASCSHGNGQQKTCGEYIKLSDEERATIGEYAAKHGPAAAIRHLGSFPNLKEASVRGWRDAYRREVFNQSNDRKRDRPVEVTELPQKRRGRPLLIGEELEEEVKLFIKASRAEGTVVNTETVMGTARGVVISHDANLLAENGGYINITKEWAQRVLQQMGLVKRKGTTKAKVLPSDFEKVKRQFLFDVRTIVAMESIPKELIINWDQTGMKYVPVSDWTLKRREPRE